jgi:hypothetical protein
MNIIDFINAINLFNDIGFLNGATILVLSSLKIEFPDLK